MMGSGALLLRAAERVAGLLMAALAADHATIEMGTSYDVYHSGSRDAVKVYFPRSTSSVAGAVKAAALKIVAKPPQACEQLALTPPLVRRKVAFKGMAMSFTTSPLGKRFSGGCAEPLDADQLRFIQTNPWQLTDFKEASAEATVTYACGSHTLVFRSG